MHDMDCVFCLFYFCSFFVIVSLILSACFLIYRLKNSVCFLCFFIFYFFCSCSSFILACSDAQLQAATKSVSSATVTGTKKDSSTDVITSPLNRRATNTQDSKLVPRTCTCAFGAWHRAIRRIISRYRGISPGASIISFYPTSLRGAPANEANHGVQLRDFLLRPILLRSTSYLVRTDPIV
ncbi:hypothetical protein GGI35DRAFT_446853 [Trichoderma velutinum]